MSCQTCAYWQHPYSDYVFVGWAKEHQRALDQGGTCGCLSLMESEGDESNLFKPDALIALGADAIWTGPEFRCSHWVKRDVG